MGLDMYLYAEKYLPQIDWEKTSAGTDRVNNEAYEKVVEAAGMADLPKTDFAGATVRTCIGYWRKANAIHSWFVDNTANGEDNCQPSHVSREQLETLRNECLLVSVAKVTGQTTDLLEPVEGFFFGGTDKDEWYYDSIKETIEILDNALKVDEDYSFVYQASW